MSSITLPLTPELVAGFGAVLPHASKDAVTPVITGVRVTMRHLIATDRYSVGQYEHTTLEESIERHGESGPDEPDYAVTLPREIAEWLAKFKPAGLQTLTLTDTHAVISWENDPESVVESRSFNSMAALNYPLVARLIPEQSDESADIVPVYLGSDIFVKVGKSAQIIQRLTKSRNAPVRMQFAPSESRYRHAPVLATIGRLVMLLQPSTPSGR